VACRQEGERQHDQGAPPCEPAALNSSIQNHFQRIFCIYSFSAEFG
jgi:hypothetical protein